MQLTRKFRPQSFLEVKGQSPSKEILRAIAKHPADQPQSLILEGSFGTGKTTMARIFAKAVNCKSRTGDACNACEACKEAATDGRSYVELDAAVVGNVEAMRDIRESLAYSTSKGYRVVVLDEVHLASRQAQSALLKILEEAPQGVFFLFCTTDSSMLLDTIHSRSQKLHFDPIPDDEITELVKKISSEEEIHISDQVLKFIVRRVRGHARDAVQAMEGVKLIGDASFMKSAKLLEPLFEELLAVSIQNKFDRAKEIITEVVKCPVMYIEQDFEMLIKQLSDEVFLHGKTDAKKRDLVFFFLKHHRLLSTTNDWYVFLSAISRMFETKAVTMSVSRFEAK